MNDLMQHLSTILKVIMAVSFTLGTVKVAYGWYNLRQGEGSVTDIIGGAAMALAPTIMYAIYSAFGLDNSAVDPHLLGS